MHRNYSNAEVCNCKEMGVPCSCSKSDRTANALAAIGSSAALIYGISEQKRWWVVLLLMIGAGGVGRGIGTIMSSKSED